MTTQVPHMPPPWLVLTQLLNIQLIRKLLIRNQNIQGLGNRSMGLILYLCIVQGSI